MARAMGRSRCSRRFERQIDGRRPGANTGFAPACNAGARAAGDCEYLVVPEQRHASDRGVAGRARSRGADARRAGRAVGAKLLFPNGRSSTRGVTIGQDGWPHHLYAGFDGEHPAVTALAGGPAATAACLLVRAADFEQLGGFDPVFHNGYEDIDLCLRLGQRRAADPVLLAQRRLPPRVGHALAERGARGAGATSERLFDERWRARLPPTTSSTTSRTGCSALAYEPALSAHGRGLARVGRRCAPDGEELAGLERLLALRSRQVMELTRRPQQLTRDFASGRRSATALAPRHGSCGPREWPTADRAPAWSPRARHACVSVLIPVKNGERHLAELLPLILGQSISARLEIVAVDSGSDRRHDRDAWSVFGATVLAIDPAEFDHGLTRNLARRARSWRRAGVPEPALAAGGRSLAGATDRRPRRVTRSLPGPAVGSPRFPRRTF